MAPELSSNWKVLQAKLKQESDISKEKKRKAIPTERQKNSLAKRRRLDESSSTAPQSKKQKMGLMGSMPAVTEPEKAASASLATWAEDNDISPADLAAAYGTNLQTGTTATTPDTPNIGLCPGVEIGKYIGVDCEMVGVGGDEDRSALARVSIVNFHGALVYDSFVRPLEFVTDWRTHVSGVSAKHMTSARSFSDVQAAVAEIMKDRVVVGHAIKNDLEVLGLGHPRRDIRDTSRFSGFRKFSAGRTPSLKKLAKEVLGVEIQGGEHSSVEDARVTMLLFRREKSAFDVEHAVRFPAHAPGSGSAAKGGNKKKKKKSKR